MNTKQEQDEAVRPARKSTNNVPEDKSTEGTTDTTSSIPPALRPAKSGLLKTFATKIARSSSSLRPPAENNTSTPEQIADARLPSSLAPATVAERRKSLAPARLLSVMSKGATTKSQGNLRDQASPSPPNSPPPGTSARDRRRAEALQSLGLLPASRRYSSVFPEVFVEPKAEGGRDGMSAADIIRQEWMKKIKEEGDEDEESATGEDSDGASKPSGRADAIPQTPIIATTTRDSAESRQENASHRKPKSRVPAPLVLPSSPDGSKAKLSAWKFPKSPKSPRSPSSSAMDGEESSSPAPIAESPTSMTSGERLKSPQTGTTVFFSAPSSPAKLSPSPSPKNSRHATTRSDGSELSSMRSSVLPQSPDRQTSSTIATSVTEASVGVQVSNVAKHRRTGSNNRSASSVPSSPHLRSSVLSKNSAASSDKVNDWLSKTPVVSRPSTQPPSPSRVSSGNATPRQSTARRPGPAVTLTIDSLTLPAAMIPLPLSPADMSPRLLPLPASPVDAQPPLSPSLVPLPSSPQATPAFLPATSNVPQKKPSTSSTLESGVTVPSLSLAGTSLTSAGPATPISPLDIVAPDRSLPPSPVIPAQILEDTVPPLDTEKSFGSPHPEHEISAVNGTTTDVSQIILNSDQTASPLADQASGRTSERTVDGAVQSAKSASKGIFSRRRNTKESKEQLSTLTIPLLPRASTSFNNLKKSVVASLSVGPKSKQTKRNCTDPPGLSTRNMNVLMQDQLGPDKIVPPRVPTPNRSVPLSPTMHSTATIMLEAGAIEDEESRRLSEMAFLL